MDGSLVDLDQSQIKRKQDESSDDLKTAIKRTKPVPSFNEILGLIERYISAQEPKTHENSNDLLSLAVLALDQHENGPNNTQILESSTHEPVESPEQTTDYANRNFENLYLNFYIDDEIVLNIEEYSPIGATCNLCHSTGIENIKTHLETHKVEANTTTTTCVFCNKAFNYKLQFDMHRCEYIDYETPIMRKSDNTDDYYYLCQLCTSTYNNVDDPSQNNEKFLNYDLYKDHLKTKHFCAIECLLCASTHDNADAYVHHLKSEHALNSLICTCAKC